MPSRVTISLGVLFLAVVFYVTFMNVNVEVCLKEQREQYVNQTQVCDIHYGLDGHLYCDILNTSGSGYVNLRCPAMEESNVFTIKRSPTTKYPVARSKKNSAIYNDTQVDNMLHLGIKDTSLDETKK